ncbi:MAG: hypothetical protein ACXADB_10480, partial [Candidatus Hermodarchaeia archaeon]
MKGMWWNPLNNGEGFIFAEEGNRTFGYYFTHLGRTAVWYMLSLTENLQGYAGQVFRVETRINAVPGNPGHSHDNPPREISVGTCEILDQGDESFIIDLDINNDQIRYQIGSLFGTGFEAFG